MINCLSGGSIRIQVVYKDFNGNLIDPSTPNIVIYDKSGKKIAKLEGLAKESTGTYHYDYITPFVSKKDAQYFCEACDGDVVVCRDTFTTQFMIKAG